MALVVGLGVVGLVGCGRTSPEPGRAAEGTAAVRRLYAQAVEDGYDGQAQLLADGRASFADLRDADEAMIRCADRRGVVLEAFSYVDMQGRRDGVEPADGSGTVDAGFVNGVIDDCQRSEQLLVDQAFALGRPEISEAAFRLWQSCASAMGYAPDVPKSYRRISRELPAEVVNACEPKIMGELAGSEESPSSAPGHP